MGKINIGIIDDENFRKKVVELERIYEKLCERYDNYKRKFRKRKDPAKWQLEQQPTKAYRRIIDEKLELMRKINKFIEKYLERNPQNLNQYVLD